MTFLVWLSVALAAPTVTLVGVHVPGLLGSNADQAVEALKIALEEQQFKVELPEDMARRLSGKENLVVEDYALVPGREMVQEGRILYDRAQPADAVPVVKEGIAALQRALSIAPAARDLQDAWLLLALCHLANGDDPSAQDAFVQAAMLDTSRELENASYSPEARRLFDDARKKVTTLPPGHLWVSSSSEARIFVDGRELGPAPLQDQTIVEGTHVVVARGTHGSSASRLVTVESGRTQRVDAVLERRNLGVAAEDASGRSRQVRSLYQGLGRYSGADLLLIAGVSGDKIMLQLYDPQAGNFSKVETEPAGTDPLGELVSNVGKVMAFADGAGGIKAEKVSPLVAALDVSTNDVLAGLLLDPVVPEAPVSNAKSLPWYLWAGIGAVVVGGGTAGLVVALNPREEPVSTTGAILVGPWP